jgi:hypothetical protein
VGEPSKNEVPKFKHQYHQNQTKPHPKLGTVAYAYNPSYSGGDWEDHDSRPVQARSSQDPISIKLGTVAHVCHPSYLGKHKQENHGSSQPRHKCETLYEQ